MLRRDIGLLAVVIRWLKLLAIGLVTQLTSGVTYTRPVGKTIRVSSPLTQKSPDTKLLRT